MRIASNRIPQRPNRPEANPGEDNGLREPLPEEVMVKRAGGIKSVLFDPDLSRKTQLPDRAFAVFAGGMGK
jgi:hypothetical protein